MLFLLSCILSYEAEQNKTTVGLEQTRAMWYVNHHHGYNSSVKISTIDNGLISGHGSGNYFKIGRERFIITAAHVVSDGAAFFVMDNGEPVFLETVYMDNYYDIAIMSVHRKLETIKATEYRNNKKVDILGMSVNYSGYPADLPKVMLTGTISHSGISYAIMQSYAVPGSSGSIVFDNAGRAIGVINAVRVGMYELSPFPHLEENIVYVERLIRFDRKRIREILKLWRLQEN
jgi:S1-C subfamily serine protease